VQIDHTVLAKLERLSHLHVDADKQEEIIEQLSAIVAYMENLNERDTDHLDPAFSTLTGGTPMREDTPDADPTIVQTILEHAPEQMDDFFIVPAIIDTP
jgi:aspartyl-tRNA(Asn)/glutamyl-tRNA(Gln) amidotransferase subunit C